MTARPQTQIALLATGVLLAMTLWFSATAVLPAIVSAWQLGADAAAGLTVAVQLGFVAGALTSAFLNLPDRLPPRHLLAISAVAGALANLALAWFAASLAPALVLRFCTGACLAGVYPPGMKIAAGHVSGRSRGLAIGVLVGAVTLGSATPHLVAGLFDDVDLSYRAVLTTSSVLALLGALTVLLFVRDGAHASPPAPFDPRQIGLVLRDRGVRLANLGYCGHMWELYAMWTWLVVFLGNALDARDARLIAFAAIGVAGALGAALGGRLADRYGRTTITIGAMAISGACCLCTPLVFGAPAAALLVFALVWGASAVADSAQFSAAVTELAERSYVGTALTLQTCIGFALTMVSIQGLPLLADAVGWRYAFVVLAPGPLLGCVAMLRLRRSPQATRLAGGRR